LKRPILRSDVNLLKTIKGYWAQNAPESDHRPEKISLAKYLRQVKYFHRSRQEAQGRSISALIMLGFSKSTVESD